MSAALDTGSAFEGMGGAREATFSCLAEPALFLGLLVLVKRSGSLSLATMLGTAVPGEWRSAGRVARARRRRASSSSCSRRTAASRSTIPNTHLELTMIHEVMVLDHGGPAFGMILYGAAAEALRPRRDRRRHRRPVPRPAATSWTDSALFVAGMLLLAVRHRRRRVGHGAPAPAPGAEPARGGVPAVGLRDPSASR